MVSIAPGPVRRDCGGRQTDTRTLKETDMRFMCIVKATEQSEKGVLPNRTSSPTWASSAEMRARA